MTASLEWAMQEMRRRDAAEEAWLGATTQGRPSFAETELLYRQGVPSCHAWQVPEGEVPEHLTAVDALRRWQACACAMCSATGQRLVIDHDHQTGAVRGLLCYGCNTAEAFSDDAAFAAYRDRPPAVMLQVAEQYGSPWDGFGVKADRREGGQNIELADDLGRVQVERHGQRRIYRPRAALLAEVVTPETFVMILDWLSSTRRGSLQTKRNYADDIRRVWATYAQELGHERFALGILTPDHIRAWRIRMEAEGAARSTVARYLNSLSSLHAYAAGKIDLPRNPVVQSARPKVERNDPATSAPVLEVEEIQAVVACAQSEFDLLVVSLLYTLAGRVTEMCAANVTDRVECGRRSCLDVTRKKHRERILPLPLSVAEMLDAHTAGRTEGPLLLDSEGKRLDRHDVARMLARLGRHAGVLPGRTLTPHVIRASRITHMLDAGVPLAEAQAFADHDNPMTTVGYWSRRNKKPLNVQHVDNGEAVFASVTPRFRRRP